MSILNFYEPNCFISIPPYMDLGPVADYSAKLEAAKKHLGPKWCLAVPINRTNSRVRMIAKREEKKGAQ